jgi:hypothetical protein
MNDLIDKNGRPLKGAALQARLSALQRQELEQKARQYLETHPPLHWDKFEVDEKIPVLVSLNNLFEDYCTHDSIISIETIEPSQTLIQRVEFPVFETAKAIGYALAVAGGSLLFFLSIHGGKVDDVKDAGATLGAGVAIIKLFSKQNPSDRPQ